MQNLVIVESPTKARTLSNFLGKGYQIVASMGHVRDLPKSNLGIDIGHNFTPSYIIPKAKVKMVNQLKKEAKEAKTLWLATDPDREGEAIAWHLSELLSNPQAKNETRRVVFHEITEGAIKEAFLHPRELDLKLVDAQQARRVLDRLVGYKLSPLLWKKVKSGLSAGRVQSVAVRLVVEREREIQAFKPVEYWSVIAELLPRGPNSTGSFGANLIELSGKKLEIHNQVEADVHVEALKDASYLVDKIIRKEVKRYPSPPFTTSTLQQTAANKLGFTAKKTMSIAQFLYEHGLITYMRTDSLNLSTLAIQTAREVIEKEFGKTYLPATAKFYKTKSKVAQEAHEAIRPTDFRIKDDQLKFKEGISKDHVRLYDLIWKRTVASQTKEAVLERTTVDVKASEYQQGSEYKLRVNGSVIKFDGWLKLYQVSSIKYQGEEDTEQDEGEKQILPNLEEGQKLDLKQLLPEQHFTEASPRYNEASLIKKLEELGIGRPSTYAPTLSTIQERFYIEKTERKFVATPLGMAVTDFLLEHFPDIIDYSFTALMEDELDEVAKGERSWKPLIAKFYTPFEKRLVQSEGADRVKVAQEVTDRICPECGKPLVIRYGKFGKFLACSGFPECKHTEPLEGNLNMVCPKCKLGEVVTRKTKKGRIFYGCSKYPECDFASWNKPKTAGT